MGFGIDAKSAFDYAGLLGDLPRWGPLGKWESRIGHIEQAFATPCSTTPMLWVEASFVAAPRLAYLFAKPFLIAEVAHRFLNSRCGRKKKGKPLSLTQIVEGALETAAEIPPMGESLGWTAFKIATEFALKAEWYFMIIDRSTEFLYNWTSLPYEWSGCRIGGDPFFDGRIRDGDPVGSVTGQITNFDTIGASEMEMDFYVLRTHTGLGVTCFASVGLTTDSTGHPPCSFTLTLYRNGVPQGGSPMESVLGKDGKTRVTIGSPYEGGETGGEFVAVINYHNLDGAHSNTSSGSVMQAYGHDVGKKGLNFDP